MGMGIRNFYAQATQTDFSRDFQLRVLEMGGILNDSDNVYITTANLPGYSISNIQTPFMGLDFNIPGSAKFPGSDSWAVTYRCDQQLNIRQKFVNWQSSIFNAFPNSAGQSTGNYAPKGMESVAKLVVHDRDGNPVRAFQLIGVYPVTIGEVSYDQTGNGAIATMTATMAYQWWEPMSAPGNVLA